MENSITKKMLLSILGIFIVFICFCIKDSKAATTSGTVDGVTWYYTYSTSSGPATNVYTRQSVSGKLTVPSKIGSHTVTSIGYGSSNRSILYQNTSNTTVTSVEIPDTVTTISPYCFRNLTALTEVTGMNSVQAIGNYAFYGCSSLDNVSLPETLTSIGTYSFYNCTALTSLNLPESLTSIGNYAFYNCKGIKGDLIIPENVSSIGTNCFQSCTGLDGNLEIKSDKLVSIANYAFSGCNNIKKITLPGTLKNVGSYSFEGQKDVWVDGEEGNISFVSNWGGIHRPFIHYKGCTHTINVATLDGIKIIDEETGEEFKSGEYDCESSHKLKIQVEDESRYINLKLVEGKQADYEDQEDVYTEIEENSYTIDKLLRNVSITTQNLSEKMDLVLRTYIDSINDEELDVSRNVIIGLASVKPRYLHTKYPAIVKNGDIIKYKVKVWNEGKAQGSANKITEHLPEGLEFITDNDINKQYRWEVSEDGKIVTTDYLKDKTLIGYTGLGMPSSQTIEIVLKVTANQDDTKVVRLTNIAEITEQSGDDADSTPNNFNEENLEKYKFDEAVESNSVSYIEGQEDDDDFENVVILRRVPVTYTLQISKVDNSTFELLNGAKFDLLDENKQILQSGVTVKNGKLKFEPITTYDEGVDIYYISESETPTGYESIIDGSIKVKVIKTIIDRVKETYKIKVECDLVESWVDTTVDDSSVIPIYDADQLSKIGSGDTITIKGEKYKFTTDKDYRLMNDINLSGQEWTPIEHNVTGIFDGNNHTITGLTITKNVKKDVGLFAKYSGVIQNLKVADVNINIDLQNEIEQIKLKYPNIEKEVDPEKKEEYREELKKLLDSYHVGGLVGAMTGGSVINCTISGEIESDSNNVGGFIGYCEDQYLVIMKKCINNSNVTSNSYNVGGLIGNSNSALNLRDCENNGVITAASYNAGGLVGYEDASGYTSNSAKVEYDENTNIINVVVGNAKAEGFYTINLRKIDADTQELLDGSKFTVCDKDKTPINGLEELELKGGTLKLDPIKVESVGSDIYYLKEISAPKGYKLIENYIKLQINKSWDGVNSEYIITVEDPDNTHQNEPGDDDVLENDDTHTGDKFVYEQTDGVSWLVNKAVLSNCTNNGAIITGKGNGSGMIAKTNCTIDIDGCKNTAEINIKSDLEDVLLQSSTGSLAGLLAEVEKKDENTLIEIRNSSNSGNISMKQETSVRTINTNAGGLVGFCKADTTITKSTNTGDIQGSAASGIISYAKEAVTIDNATNEGTINATDIGSGIISKAINGDVKLNIVNSTNTGDITAAYHTGGIAGFVVCEKAILEECNNNEATISSSGGASGGIVGMSVSNIDLENCETTNNTITASYEKEGGIIGLICPANIEGYNCSPAAINIKDCNATNLTMLGNSTIKGGIAGFIFGENAGIKEVNLINCNSDNVKINYDPNDSENSNNQMVQNNSAVGSFIVGQLQSTTNVTIDNCDVENSDLVNCTNNFGGICGLSIQNMNSLEGKTNIKGCDVNKITSNGSGRQSGIIGTIIDQKNNNNSISNCSVNEFTSLGQSDIGGIVAAIVNSGENTFTDCNVSNTNVKATSTSDLNHTGGIVGYSISNNIGINNCDVTSSTINAIAGKNGGIIGDIAITSSYQTNGEAKVNLENCNVLDTSVIGLDTTNASYGSYCSSTMIGQIVGSDVIIRNCEVKSTEDDKKLVISGKAKIGAVLSYTDKKVTLDNVNASNIEISTSNNNSDGVGGILGVITHEVNATNCEYNDITIDNSKGSGFTGGFIAGQVYDKTTLDKCAFDNISITTGNCSQYNIGGIASYINGELNSNNSTYSNITVNATGNNSMSVGGIVGHASKLNMSEDTINKINITSENCAGPYSAYIGGIVGINSNSVDINDTEISDIEIMANGNTAGHTAGVVGTGLTFNMESDTIDNITITSKSTISTAFTAGVIAICGNGKINNTNISNITASSINNISGVVGCASDLEINTDENSKSAISNIELESTSKDITLAGGIVSTASSNKYIKNINMNDITIETSGLNSRVGGVLGVGNSIIKNITMDNGDIKNTYSSPSSQVGGIVGVNTSVYNEMIEDIKITNSRIESSGDTAGGIAGSSSLNINNCSTDGTTVKGATNAGGIVGFDNGKGTSRITISNSKVENGSVIGSDHEQNFYGYVGGIAGFAGGDVTNCNVTGTNIISTSNSAYGLGGIVGHGNNVKVNSLDKCTKIEKCIVTDCTILGKTAVGGIAGAAVPEITGCKVIGTNDVVVKTEEEQQPGNTISSKESKKITSYNVVPSDNILNNEELVEKDKVNSEEADDENNNTAENTEKETQKDSSNGNIDFEEEKVQNGDNNEEKEQLESSESKETQEKTSEKAPEQTSNEEQSLQTEEKQNNLNKNMESKVSQIAIGKDEAKLSTAIENEDNELKQEDNNEEEKDEEKDNVANGEKDDVTNEDKDDTNENSSDEVKENVDNNVGSENNKVKAVTKKNVKVVNNKVTENEVKLNKNINTINSVPELEETQNDFSTTITGNNFVGGIIGYGGALSIEEPSKTYFAVTLTDCEIQNIKIEGTSDVKEDIGKNSYYTGAAGDLVDQVINFIKNNFLVLIKQ